MGKPADIFAGHDIDEYRLQYGPGGTYIQTIRASAIEPEDVTWVWKSYVPLGKLTDISGDPGEGKSTVALAIASAVTTGSPLPGSEDSCTLGHVLVVSAEDGPADTIRPRLDMLGADLERVHILEGVTVRTAFEAFTLSSKAHIEALDRKLARTKPSLVIVDPITAFLGGTDSHKDAGVRTILKPLADLAQKHQCAIISIRHLRKSAADRAIYRGGGSIAFTAAARSQLLVGHSPTEAATRALVPIKSNLAPLGSPVGFVIESGRFRWTETQLTAADLLAPDPTQARTSALDEARTFLQEVLSDGPVPVTEVEAEAAGLGLSLRTLKRARKSLGLRAQREGGSDGRWTLSLKSKGAK